MERPKVGVGIIIENNEGQILVGKRKGSHSPFFSIPGGHLELGEQFEEAAIKEVMEETGMQLIDPQVFCVTNNLETFELEGLHFISVNLYSNQFTGKPRVMEKDKCEGWEWVDPENLPQPHFEASTKAVKCFLRKEFYHK